MGNETKLVGALAVHRVEQRSFRRRTTPLATTARPTTSEESSKKSTRPRAKLSAPAKSDSAAATSLKPIKCYNLQEHSECASVQRDIDLMVSPLFRELQPHKLQELHCEETQPPTKDTLFGTDNKQAVVSNSNDDVADNDDAATDETVQPPPRSNRAHCF